ncbi:MAG: CbiX/SirB N-terminal domain-containing protein [Thalassovita sp.]
MTHPSRSAVIVAHGSPSDPDPQERDLQALAAKVNAALPEWDIRGATLAAEGALDAAIDALNAPLIYPYFMAEGYFTGRVLAPKSKSRGLTQLRPFGVDPHLADCAEAELQAILLTNNWNAGDTALLVAAHGSAVSRTSANSTHAMAGTLHARMGFLRTRTGFIEEPPHVQDMARGLGQAICLPFFALNAGHMLDDMPQALGAANFTGHRLPAMIDWASTPRLIADCLERAAP